MTPTTDLSAVRGIKGCGCELERPAIWGACVDDCAACLSLLVEGIVALERPAIRREAFEELARLADEWERQAAKLEADANAALARPGGGWSESEGYAVCRDEGGASELRRIVAQVRALSPLRALAGGKEEG